MINLLYIIPTYNRPRALTHCIETLFSYSSPLPDETWFLDDGSDIELREGLLKMQITSRYEFPVNLILCNKNYGIGWNFELIYNIIRWKNPKIVAIIESDYIWRREFLADVLAVFEASPYTLGIPGLDHQDFHSPEKIFSSYPSLMLDFFGSDVKARPYLFKEFDLETTRGKIKVCGSSNSCGCSFLHWERINQFLFKQLGASEEYWKIMDRAFNKGPGLERNHASDGHMSQVITFLWDRWAERYGIDITQNFAWLNICDFSLSQHLSGGGKCNEAVPEGQTIVGAPNLDSIPFWMKNYKIFTRKI